MNPEKAGTQASDPRNGYGSGHQDKVPGNSEEKTGIFRGMEGRSRSPLIRRKENNYENYNGQR